MTWQRLSPWVFPSLGRGPDDVLVTIADDPPPREDFERLHPSLGYYLVNEWISAPEPREQLAALWLELTGEDLVPSEAGARKLVALIEDERLYLWSPMRAGVTEPPMFPARLTPLPGSHEMPMAEDPSWRLINFELERATGHKATHIASGAEDPKPRFTWQLVDPQHQVIAERIEFFRTHVPEETTPFAIRHLTLGRLLSEEDPFDGFVGHPGGYLSCEHSPYRARLVVEGRIGVPQSLEVGFRVEPVKLLLRLGPRNLLSLPRNLEVYDKLRLEAGSVLLELANSRIPAWPIEGISRSAPAPVSLKRRFADFLCSKNLFIYDADHAEGTAAFKVFDEATTLARFATQYPASARVHEDWWLAEELWLKDDDPAKGMQQKRDMTGSPKPKVRFRNCQKLIAAAVRWLPYRVARAMLSLRIGVTVVEFGSNAVEIRDGKPGPRYSQPMGITFEDERRQGLLLVLQDEESISLRISHELGHELFLPHPTPNLENANPRLHDPADDECIMSYSKQDHFCGFCVLRLRGWDIRTLIEEPDAPA